MKTNSKKKVIHKSRRHASRTTASIRAPKSIATTIKRKGKKQAIGDYLSSGLLGEPGPLLLPPQNLEFLIGTANAAPAFSGPYVHNPNLVLTKAAEGIAAHSLQRDLPSGERSMRRTIDAFNAITGNAITEHDGWLFMMLHKAAHAAVGEYVAGDYQAGAAYFALAGECASKTAMDAALAAFRERNTAPGATNG